MFGIGLPELIVILVLALIVLGPEKLPVVAKQVARFMNDLKKATDEFKQELDLDRLDDIKNPVKLDNLLGEDINRLRKDLTQPDFLPSDSSKEKEDARDEKKTKSTLGGLGPDWQEAKGRGKKQLSSGQESESLKDKKPNGE